MGYYYNAIHAKAFYKLAVIYSNAIPAKIG